MPVAQAAGATIHYSVEGGGRDSVLLLMGLGGHAAEWGSVFVNDLASDHQVIRMDNRGIAQSRSEQATWTLDDMADDARTVLDALSLKRSHVLGISMGGMIAQVLAAKHPERVGRLILMSTSFGGTEAIPPAPRGAAIFEPQPGVPLAEQRRRGLRALAADGFADDHPDLIEELVAYRDRNPTTGRAFKAQFEALLLSDRSELVSQIHRPTLVLHGDCDPLVPPRNGELLSERIAGAKLVMLRNCGHMPNLEKPVETARIIREFLAEPIS